MVLCAVTAEKSITHELDLLYYFIKQVYESLASMYDFFCMTEFTHIEIMKG